MGQFYNPETNEWEDDGLDWVPEMYGGATSPMMPQLGMGPTLLGDYNKYGMEPYEQGDANQQMTFVKNLLGLMYDPRMMHMIATETGADVFPYEQLATPGNPFMQGMDLPQQGMGGMGGGGGYSGGGGGGQQFMTNNINWARGSTDPVMQTIVQQLDQDVDPWTVKNMLASSPETDQNQLDTYNEAIDTLWDEKGKAMIAGAQGGGFQQLQPNALQQQVAKWGVVNPLEQYGPGNLPADIDMNRYLPAPNTAGIDKRLRAAEQNAMYEAIPSKAAASTGAASDPFSSALAAQASRWGSVGRGGGTGQVAPDAVAMDTPETPSKAMVEWYRKNPDKIENLRPELQDPMRRAMLFYGRGGEDDVAAEGGGISGSAGAGDGGGLFSGVKSLFGARRWRCRRRSRVHRPRTERHDDGTTIGGVGGQPTRRRPDDLHRSWAWRSEDAHQPGR